MTGLTLERTAPNVATIRRRFDAPPMLMHLPDPTPDNRAETRFTPDGTGTLLVMTMTVPDAQTLEAMLATGMTGGMEIGYARLEKIL